VQLEFWSDGIIRFLIYPKQSGFRILILRGASAFANGEASILENQFSFSILVWQKKLQQMKTTQLIKEFKNIFICWVLLRRINLK